MNASLRNKRGVLRPDGKARSKQCSENELTWDENQFFLELHAVASLTKQGPVAAKIYDPAVLASPAARHYFTLHCCA